MIGSIGFDNLHISCIIGMLEEERVNLQNLFVDMRIETDFTKCAQTDEIHDTLDYVMVANLCQQIAKENKFHLLEAYAAAVIKRLFTLHNVISVMIRIKKPAGLPNADCSIVELFQKKDV